MKNKKIFVYLLVTFIFTEGCWLAVIALLGQGTLVPGSPLFILYVLGGFGGPVISAFLTKRFFCDRAEYKDFLRQIIRVRVNPGWYLFVTITPLALIFLPWLANLAVAGKQQLAVQQPLYMFFMLVPFMMIGGGFEELGWRGVLLPGLLKKRSVLVSTVVVAFFWTLWHIPLWFIKGVSQYGSSFAAFALNVIGLALILTVVYIKTGSLFLCILLHAIDNAYKSIFSLPALDSSPEIVAVSVRFVLCAAIFAAFILQNRKKALINTTTA